MGVTLIFRYIFLYFFIVITYLISGLIVNSLQCVLYFCVRPFNKYLYRKINYYLCYSYYCQMAFYSVWYSSSDFYVHMNKKDYEMYLGKEHACIIMNHKYEVDWLFIGIICDKVHCLGNYKAYMKKVIQYMPAIGWCLFFGENVFLERSFDKDQKIITNQIGELVDHPDPMWLVMFPEGTRFSPSKHEESLKFAKEKKLQELKYHLTPRTKGFLTSMPPMRGKLGAIYDVTLTFDPNAKVKPTMLNLLLGRKTEAHFYIKRIPFETVPEDEKEATKFLHDIFQKKDKLQESFFNTGDYFSESGVEREEQIKISPNYILPVVVSMWYLLIMGPLIYYLLKILLIANVFSLLVILTSISILLLLFYILLDVNTVGSSHGMADSKKLK